MWIPYMGPPLFVRSCTARASFMISVNRLGGTVLHKEKVRRQHDYGEASRSSTHSAREASISDVLSELDLPEITQVAEQQTHTTHRGTVKLKPCKRSGDRTSIWSTCIFNSETVGLHAEHG
ncbi:unnamed protein product [Zymoseptoria tritici ST99CH_3D7]|uniref:Uncharacterized protein n=1 Tax=Zymoseptoria tritici (strain ST99CH_3D7) TaxID=1276538 RepID=A0A1X7RX23_ZYMT9|nr:unnamed protein product [Zymoseptoria tritici ST99CH_3D7]